MTKKNKGFKNNIKSIRGKEQKKPTLILKSDYCELKIFAESIIVIHQLREFITPCLQCLPKNFTLLELKNWCEVHFGGHKHKVPIAPEKFEVMIFYGDGMIKLLNPQD